MVHQQFPKSVLVTGANRGIGFGLVQQFLKHKEVEHVFAGTRNPDNAKELNEITDARLTVVKLDINCDKSIEAAVQEVSKVVGEEGLHCLVNNAGVLIPYKFSDAPNRQKLEDQLLPNVVSQIMVTHNFLPLIRKAAYQGSWGVAHAAILNISSDFGSITSAGIKGSGEKGFIPYKCSKAAVNQFTHTLSEDLDADGILVAAFHPGWVQTDMGGQEAPTDIEESANNLVTSFSHLEHKHQGGYFDNKGEYPRSVLITGANRGLGLTLVKEFMKHKEVLHIFAGVRNPDKADELNAISDARVVVVKLDVECDKTIASAVEEVSKVVGEYGLNCLINNAGVWVEYNFSDKPDRKKLEQQLNPNTTSPIMVTHYFLPLIRKAAFSGSWGLSHAAIINMSSDFGSISKPDFPGSWGGWLPYKVSKAALNQFTHTLAEDLDSEGILVVAFNPGWCQTDMGGKDAPLEASDAIGQLVEACSKLEQKHNGGFYNYDGEVFPW
ncbi:unnamed protein product, partial [Mesorhabditis spiculigera]